MSPLPLGARFSLRLASIALAMPCFAQEPTLSPVGPGWARNKVNVVIFRTDPITTHADRQYVAYNDAEGRVILGERRLGAAEWALTTTPFRGNVRDAHNSISLMADGAGYLHLSWDHHGHPLRYARSVAPGTLEFAQGPMTGRDEDRVTYPCFHYLPDGGLVFFYRDGASGRGNLVANRYDPATQSWRRLHDVLISGEGRRNAYWQSAVGPDGSIHVSWTWRDTPDVATNHDIAYAVSRDGGETWARSDGTPYALPITLASAEVAAEIPQRHELMNQTSMAVDALGRPVIATYFRAPGTTVPQYFVVRHDGRAWSTRQVSQRTEPFSLSGRGSKRVPISRPQVLARVQPDQSTAVHVIYRDVTANEGRAVVASCPSIDDENAAWTVRELTTFAVGQWEPSLDRIRWDRDGVLSLFVQAVGQGDGETLEDLPPTTVQVLDWKP